MCLAATLCVDVSSVDVAFVGILAVDEDEVDRSFVSLAFVGLAWVKAASVEVLLVVDLCDVGEVAGAREVSPILSVNGAGACVGTAALWEFRGAWDSRPASWVLVSGVFEDLITDWGEELISVVVVCNVIDAAPGPSPAAGTEPTCFAARPLGNGILVGDGVVRVSENFANEVEVEL